MNYNIFARKWRPQSFNKIIGQENIVTAICNSLSLGRIHHAWLFSGSRGIGKTTIARLLAKCLNCTKGITYIPCRKCITCVEIEKGLCLDFIEVDAASRTRVEEIKEILDNIYYAPTKGRFKIYLIDEVHMLSRHSFNAFLKILEEPPQHVKFILATTDINRIPNTIISRCLNFNLKILSSEKILHFIKYVLHKEKINSDNDALKIISYYSQGSMRDALNLIEQAIAIGNGQINQKNVIDMLGIPTQKQVFLLTFSLLKKNAEKTISLLHDISTNKIEWENILVEVLRYLHHIAMIQSYPLLWKDKNITCYMHKINDIKNIVNKYDIQTCYQIILNGRKELPFAPNPQIGIEMILLRAINAIQKD